MDPVYLRDARPALGREAESAIATAAGPIPGDDFCILPGNEQAVAIRASDTAMRCPVYAWLAGTGPTSSLIGGLWLPLDPTLRQVMIDLDGDRWVELGTFSVDGGAVAVFDIGLVNANWERVNDDIDEVIDTHLRIDRDFAQQQVADSDTTDNVAEDSRPNRERDILPKRAFEIEVGGETIILSSTGIGDGRYQVYALLDQSEGSTDKLAGLWIDFGQEDDELVAGMLSGEQRNILSRMRAHVPEWKDNVPNDLQSLGAGALFNRISHLLWQARLRGVPTPLPADLTDEAIYSASRDKYLASEALSNSNVGAGTLASLTRSRKGWERACAARNPGTAAADLVLLAADQEAGVAILVAENPSTPAKTLRILASSADYGIRLSVAQNPATPPDAVADLAEDHKTIVRRAVAEREDLPPDLQYRILHDDPSPYVRADLLRKLDLPDETARLAILALAHMLHEDEVADFVDLLDRVGVDELDASATYMLTRHNQAEISTPPSADDFRRIEQDGDFRLRAAIANDPGCPQDILARMAAADDVLLRRRVAENPSTPAESLISLLEGDDDRAAFIAIENPAMPKEALIAALASDDSFLVDLATGHPGLSFDDVLAHLRSAGRTISYDLVSRSDCPPDFIRKLARSADKEERLLVAYLDDAPPDLLVALAHDAEAEIRSAVADNPNTPTETLAFLRGDDDGDIVMTVARSGRLDAALVAGVCDGSKNVLTASQCIELLSHGASISSEKIWALARQARSWELSTVARSTRSPLDLLELIALAVEVDEEGESENLAIVQESSTQDLVDMLSKLIAAARVADKIS